MAETIKKIDYRINYEIKKNYIIIIHLQLQMR